MQYWPSCFIFLYLSCLFCKIRDDNCTYLPGWLWGLNTFVFVRSLEQSLAHGNFNQSVSSHYDYMPFPFKMMLFSCVPRQKLYLFLLSSISRSLNGTRIPLLLLCLENSYASFRVTLRCFLLQKIFLNWHSQLLFWVSLKACAHLFITAVKTLWVVYVCLSISVRTARMRNLTLYVFTVQHSTCYIVVVQFKILVELSTELILWGKINLLNGSIIISYIFHT